MGTEQACIRIVDDDALVLRSLARLLQSVGYAVRTFSSSQDFLAEYSDGVPGCVVMDLSMPGLDGLELQQGRSALRLPFPQRITAPGPLRAILRQLAEQARAS